MNDEVKRRIKTSRIYQYEVAAELGIAETTLCVWLRSELGADRKALVMAAIERLEKKGGARWRA